MSKQQFVTPRKARERIGRLEERARFLKINPDSGLAGELSALNWAVPILKDACAAMYGELPSVTSFTSKSRRKLVTYLISRDGNKCHICREFLGEDRSVDHIIPLARGGDRTIGKPGFSAQGM